MLNNYFKFKENGTDLKTEIIGGITTFLAMAYILGINPTILSETGMPETGVFFATAMASGIACIIMGLLSRYPVGLAPGMGVNTLFTYTIVLHMNYSWEAALAAIFLSNTIFLIITLSKMREAILNSDTTPIIAVIDKITDNEKSSISLNCSDCNLSKMKEAL